MRHTIAACVLILLCFPNFAISGDQISVAPSDWPWWRGPTRNGVAAPDQSPPLEWNEDENVLWKTLVSGRGHSSPTVVDEWVFLATADEEAETQSVLCYDRETGRELWKKVVHEGGFIFSDRQPNEKSSMASSTIAYDGKRLFVNFLNNEAVLTTALALDGREIWQTKIADYRLHQGYGSSPAIYGPLVIVSADNKSGGALVGLDRETGDVVWKKSRPELPNYPSPIILHVAGRDQLILTGCDLVSSFDPLTGEKLWETPGATTECVTSTVTDGELVVTSGGYPDNHISAVRADGGNELVWRNNTRVYVPSMLEYDGYLYVITDAGVAICYEFATGDLMWKHRLGPSFTSSPVLVGDHIFITSDDGKTLIFQANPSTFKLVAENTLAGEVIATPAICGDRIYLRLAKQIGDQRQEMLYCLGKRQPK